MFGYAESEAVGQPIYLIIPDHKRDEETDILRRLKLGERIEPFERTRRRLDGQMVPVSITISPIKGRAGKLVGNQLSRQRSVCRGTSRYQANGDTVPFDRRIREAGPRKDHGAFPFA